MDATQIHAEKRMIFQVMIREASGITRKARYIGKNICAYQRRSLYLYHSSASSVLMYQRRSSRPPCIFIFLFELFVYIWLCVSRSANATERYYKVYLLDDVKCQLQRAELVTNAM